MSPATGADLPPEVIHKILGELSANPRRHWLPITSGQDCPTIKKAGLAACSLACKHWAKTIRPILFAKIDICNVQDLFTLLSFLESSMRFEPQLSKCIGALLVKLRDAETPPWLHHIQDITKHVWPLQIDLHFTVTSPIPDSASWEGHLPLYGLPRRLPGAFCRLNLLQLENLRLRSDLDLFKFVDNFPSLCKCLLRKITFIEGSSAEQRRRRGNPSTSFFYYVEAMQCEDGLPQSQLLLVSRLLSYVGRGSRIERGVWAQLLHAAAALAPADYSLASIAVMRNAFSLGPAGNFSDHYPLVLSSAASGASVQASPGWVIAQDCNLRVPAATQINKLRLQFRRVPSYEELRWDAFESAVLELAHVPEVTLSASADDVDGFKWFAESILSEKMLNRLKTAGKLILKYSTRRGREVTLEQVLAYPEAHSVGASTVQLSVAQRFDILILDRAEERDEYLHKTLSSRIPVASVLHTNSDAGHGSEM
ncbi:hypothetical protein PHLGIDRAFT_488066 [Phlebiopsis gigantea 11061_1 CR5-6]|uniref:F-box domain-containing protein n=1 Tax=Phlebiopsis gigantea (strain 11061_1 CR5-6) TaxID=745531 RepID=A0A0C3NL02_PHLG1|nr:hypothetical protein PHLGIDRAFT_488066 [Phlebiopsis gigantea 11061_1 CR5-6]